MMQSDRQAWIERVARGGFAAKALLYAIVGVLAFQAAIGSGGRMTGTKGALREITRQPFGKFLLVVIAVGLVGYAAWRIIEGVADPERKGSTAKGLALRASYVVRGLAHFMLAVQALRIASAHGSGGQDGAAAKQATSRAIHVPHGEWLVILAGVGVACFEAFAALGDGSYGRIVLAVVAAGMVAYGVYEVIQARYRRIDTHTD